MSKRDQDNEIPKHLLDWLSAISTFAAILAGVLGIFLPDDKNADNYAWGVFIPFILIAVSIYGYRYLREKRTKIIEASEPLSVRATLRGLLPFEDGDQLPGRGRDIQDLYTLVTNSRFKFGVLWGESGCGKTSVIRAGLVARLKQDAYLPVYIPKPTNNPKRAIQQALLQVESETRKGRADLAEQLEQFSQKHAGVVIILDQFEEYFLTNRTEQSRTEFVKWLGSTIHNHDLKVAFLIGIRSDFFAQLQNLAPEVPEPTSTHTTYELKNFDPEQARQIFLSAAKADGIPFENDLIHEVIGDLEIEESVRPAELQVVGTRLKRKNVFTVNKYEVLGRARGILSSYINDEIRQSINENVARLVLRLMCAETVETKSPTDLSFEEIWNRVGNTTMEGEQREDNKSKLQKILDQFVNARVMIHTDENRYNLAHDYLAPYVRSATEGVETNLERANRIFKRYLAEYREDPQARIPFRYLGIIRRHASPELLGQKRARELLLKSRRLAYSMWLVPLTVIAFLYLFLAGSYYFSIENSMVVLKSGHPSLSILPGFDGVVLETNFAENDLSQADREAVFREQETGIWLRRSPKGYSHWMDQALSYTHLYVQAKTQRLLSPAMLDNLLDDEEPDIRRQALQDLDYLLRIDPSLSNTETMERVYPLTQDADANVREVAFFVFNTMVANDPSLFTPALLDELVDLTDMSELRNSSDLRQDVIEEFGILIQWRPQVASPVLVDYLRDNLQHGDTSTQRIALETLGKVAAVCPDCFDDKSIAVLMDLMQDTNLGGTSREVLKSLAASDMVPAALVIDKLVEQLLATRSYGFSGDGVYDVLNAFMEYHPEAYTAEDVDRLAGLLDDNNSQHQGNVGYLLIQVSTDHPEMISPKIRSQLIELLPDSDITRPYEGDGNSLVEIIARTCPEQFTTQDINHLVEFLDKRNREMPANVRYIPASVIRILVSANPRSVDEATYKSFIGFMNGTDSELQNSTIRILSALALSDVSRTNEITTLLDGYATTPIALYGLAGIFSEYPQFVTTERLDMFLTNLEDDNSGVQSATIDLFSILAGANTQELPAGYATKIESLLNDPDPDVRKSALRFFSVLMQNDPGIVTPELIDLLIARLFNENSEVQGLVMQTIMDASQVAPTVFDAGTIDSLLGLVGLEKNYSLPAMFEVILENNPESLKVRHVDQVVDGLRLTSDVYERFLIFSVMSRTNPGVIQQEHVMAILSAIDENPSFLLMVVNLDTWSLLAESNPDLFPPETQNLLVDLAFHVNYNDLVVNLSPIIVEVSRHVSEEDAAAMIHRMSGLVQEENQYWTRVEITKLLSKLIREHPGSATAEEVNLLLGWMNPTVATALGIIARQSPALIEGNQIDVLFDQMKHSIRGDDRTAAGYILFVLASNNEDFKSQITGELRAMSESSNPQWRMDANKVLEMLLIGDWISEVHRDPDSIERIEKIIDELPISSPDHIQFAANVVREEIIWLEP